MKIETQTREDHQIKIVAEFEVETYLDFKRRAAKKIARTTKIPGFRPGKAPYDVVKRHYGEEVIEKEAIEILIDETYPEVLKEAKVNPSGPGTLEEILSTDPPKFSFIVPLQPETTLPDYHSIRKEYKPEIVNKKEVDQALENLKLSYATAEPVDRPSIEGDLVNLKIMGRLVKPDKDEDAEFIKESPLQVMAGKSQDGENEWPFEGFSKEVIGMAASETKTIPFTYPKKASIEKLRGKKVEFVVDVQGIKSMTLPELDQEFLQTLGDFDSPEKLTEVIKESLENQKKFEYDQNYVAEVIDTIVEQSTTKYPPNVLEDEIEHIIENLKEDLSRQKMDLETYLKTRELEEDVFIESEVRPAAIKRLERSLVLDELAKAEKIQVSNEELQKAVVQAISQMGNEIDLRQVKTNQEKKNLTTAVTYETAGRLLNQHIKERIREIASGEFEEKVKAEVENADVLVKDKPTKAASKTKKTKSEGLEDKAAKPSKKSKNTAS